MESKMKHWTVFTADLSNSLLIYPIEQRRFAAAFSFFFRFSRYRLIHSCCAIDSFIYENDSLCSFDEFSLLFFVLIFYGNILGKKIIEMPMRSWEQRRRNFPVWSFKFILFFLRSFLLHSVFAFEFSVCILSFLHSICCFRSGETKRIIFWFNSRNRTFEINFVDFQILTLSLCVWSDEREKKSEKTKDERSGK